MLLPLHRGPSSSTAPALAGGDRSVLGCWGGGGVGGHSSLGLGTHRVGALQELVAVAGIHWHLGRCRWTQTLLCSARFLRLDMAQGPILLAWDLAGPALLMPRSDVTRDGDSQRGTGILNGFKSVPLSPVPRGVCPHAHVSVAQGTRATSCLSPLPRAGGSQGPLLPFEVTEAPAPS